MKTLNLTLPLGPIAAKYADYRDNEDFISMLFLSDYGVGKSTSLVDSLAKTGLEYPGARLLLAGSTLTNLKRSTIPKLKERISLIFESENNNEATYRFPTMMHPLTGDSVQSEIRCVGVDRVDIEEMMKSTEWFRVYVEEANTVPERALDVLLLRSRQFCFHRSLRVKHMVHDLAGKWNCSAQEAYNMCKEDPNHPVFQFDLSPEHPMPGKNQAKLIANPSGNDHLFRKFVGLPFPEAGLTPEWAKNNVGVLDRFFTRAELKEIRADFSLGDFIEHKDGFRTYVKSCNNNLLATTDGKLVSADDCELVLQLYTIVGFANENHSRNVANHKNALLTEKSLRMQMFGGVVDTRSGLVFPNFDPRPFDKGGHVLSFPQNGIPAGLTGVGGVDQGGNHSTAATMAMLLNDGNNTAVIFHEYLRSGVSARDSAYSLASSVPPGIRMKWGGDPAMWARDYTSDATTYPALKYIEAGLNPFTPGKKGDQAFDDVLDLLDLKTNFMTKRRAARLYVFDNCQQVIEAMSSVTWKDIRHGRHKWIVDMADAIKLMCSMINNSVTPYSDGISVPTGGLVYSDQFAR